MRAKFTKKIRLMEIFEKHIFLTLKRVGGGMGAHTAPPSTFTIFLTQIANRTDLINKCKFINIRCGHFDTILDHWTMDHLVHPKFV